MSCKNTFNFCSKSFTEKKITNKNKSNLKNISQKEEFELKFQKHAFFYVYPMIYKNLKKYSTNKKKYQIYIINSIIFDQRIHKVAVFKNNLLWDESSEFLKRFYKGKESTERIPKISEYYEKYTLFSPIYFGLDGLVLIIMNKWTKRKKTYLEYIEDHEDEKEENKNKNKNLSFEPLINSSLITNKTSSKSILSKNTLDLSKFENETDKDLNIKSDIISNKPIKYRSKDKKMENKKSLSFSDIIDDLSSHYSILINNVKNDYNIKDKQKEKYTKNKKDINHLNKKNFKKEGKNENNTNKIKKNINYNAKSLNFNGKINTNFIAKSQIKNIESSKNSIKICLNKNNKKYILTNNNTNIIKRNNKFPLPSEIKKFQKRIMNTDNNLHKTNELQNNDIYNTKNSSKGIRVNTISNYAIENYKINSNNNILQKSNKSFKEEIFLKKKPNYNNLKNNTKKNIINNDNKKYNNINNENFGNIYNILDKNLIYKNNNLLRYNNFIKIKRKSFIERNDNKMNTKKPLTFRNNTNKHYLYERRNNSNLNEQNIINNNNFINMEKYNIMNQKDIISKRKKINQLYLEDPFIYKLSQLVKKKQVSLTANNSLTKIKKEKNSINNGISSVIENNNNSDNCNSNYNLIYNYNKLKSINYKKNLVLSKLNNIIYDKFNKFKGEDIIRNYSTSLYKNSNENNINPNISHKILNSQSFRPIKKNSKNINLNLNLNIHFNIDVVNRNKGKKLLLNNTLINQLQAKINKNEKYQGIIRNKDIIHQYPLTSRNSKRNLKDINKIKYNILKKY